MRRQVLRFSEGLNSCQRCTSSKLRPQPLHQASPWLVEQIAMHGVSGVLWYQSNHAVFAGAGMVTSSTSVNR